MKRFFTTVGVIVLVGGLTFCLWRTGVFQIVFWAFRMRSHIASQEATLKDPAVYQPVAWFAAGFT